MAIRVRSDETPAHDVSLLWFLLAALILLTLARDLWSFIRRHPRAERVLTPFLHDIAGAMFREFVLVPLRLRRKRKTPT